MNDRFPPCRGAFRPGGPNLYPVQAEDGAGLIREYEVFPGIWLAFKDVRGFAFRNDAASPGGLLEITHCRAGRLEYEDRTRAFFLGAGDMAVRRSDGAGALLRCPVRLYQGLSVVIHPGLAPRCTSCLLGDVDVHLPALCQRLCGKGRPFLMRSTPRLEHIFAELYEVPPAIQKGYYKVKVLELLLFLSCLDPAQSQWQARVGTPAQSRLARAAIAHVYEHRSRRLTVAGLAQALCVSPEQLRAAMQTVYGKPVYQCVRSYKMRLAARLLAETDRTVADIAGEFGYDNSSKFAAAFREVLGRPPAAYRRQPDAPLFGAEFPAFGVENEPPPPL